ncbi:hypothetical protein GV791_24735 [Nocardia cyriacigeorgica]|uniref:Uncharacterized protein n=1 Tax=Nocardia cyriacigeorgica TaxID=135487 RepID=A0A6P1CT72_9NOCA|nr:hypothetical protein [Nocardia cyriacigeorgica]MBF6081393.1 hypothetical protein [Nocardia cyriacigeorgica]MBF6424237.1 hypothetical protein [Nocardia cyriacigeorgica]NEW35748.1 hypothetical protein [Nocardia cyriacigeorgica]BDU08021.1 hypothetical protein FMUBM48_42840 [Nocardia cyriacigeorgica]
MANYPAERAEVTVPTQPRYDLETGFDMLRMSNSPHWRDLFSLELEQPLPDVCSVHGAPAVDRWSAVVVFRRTARGVEQESPGVSLREFASGLFRFGYHSPPVVGDLHGEWPVCRRCVRRTTALRWIARTLIALGLPLLPALFIALQLGTDRIHPAWVLAFFPGWFPVGVLIAMLIYQAAKQFIRFRPIDTPDSITIRAHPAFADAVAAQRS